MTLNLTISADQGMNENISQAEKHMFKTNRFSSDHERIGPRVFPPVCVSTISQQLPYKSSYDRDLIRS